MASRPLKLPISSIDRGRVGGVLKGAERRALNILLFLYFAKDNTANSKISL